MSSIHRTHPTRAQLQRTKVTTFGLVALAIATSLSCPASAMTCLSTSQISSTKVVDAKTIDFKLNNGQTYRNAMRSSCNGLKFSGFIYRSFGGQICDYQAISILQSGGICALGAFVKKSTNLTPAN